MNKFFSSQWQALGILILVHATPMMLWGNDTLRIGIIRFKTPEQVMGTYEPLFTKVGQDLKKVVQIELVDETELGYALAKHRYDLGIFPPFPYLRAKQDFADLEVFGSHHIGDTDHFSGAILTLKSASINSLHDLSGKKMLFVKPSSTSGYLFPKGILTEHGIDLEADDIAYEFSGGHDLSLLSLLNGETDAIAIDKQAITKMDSLMDKVKYIYSYSIPYHAYVFSPSLAKEQREQIKHIMFEAHKNPQYSKLFTNSLGLSQWISINDGAYNSLRRFLRFVRIKPTLRIQLEAKSSAKNAFAEKGDLLELLEDNIEEELRNTHRFIITDITHQNHYHDLNLVISMVEDQYPCQIFLDGKRIEYFTNVQLDQLLEEIPKGVTHSVLNQFDIHTDVLKRGDKWFITYGSNDGISLDQYIFTLVREGADEVPLNTSSILALDESNTYLDANLGFQAGDQIHLSYAGTGWETTLKSSMPEQLGESGSFWDDKDNQWGVIGLLVTLVGVIIGTYFSRKKQKRFRRILRESNNLLLEYIKGRYKLDNEIIAHKDKINQFLEKGYISENQYLILKNRIEDIHKLINQIIQHPEEIEQSIRQEVEQIIQDGIITEKEYSRLVSIVQKNQQS